MKQRNQSLGAAHNGPATGHRWMRAPLLAEEGDGGSSASPAATQPAETPPAAANVGKTFSQEEVNRIAAQAREEGRKAASKATPAPVAAPVPAPVSQPSAEEPQGRLTMRQLEEKYEAIANKLQVTEQRAAFDKIAARFDMTDEQANDYFSLALNAKPTDVKQWLETKGFKPAASGASPAAPTAAATPTQATEAPKQTATAPTAPTAPVSPATHQGLVDLFALSEQQLAQLGPAGLRQHFETALKVGRQQQGLPQRPQAPARK